MKVLVTGGAGYLGSILVKSLLDHGDQIRVLDSLLHGLQPLNHLLSHPNLEFVQGDIRDRQRVQASLANIEAVIHLAAIVGDPACARDVNRARETNFAASVDLLEECGRANVDQFIFASTCSNYGCMPDAQAFADETSPLAPVSVYAETKVEFERALLESRLNGEMSCTALRLATLYGISPRMRFDLTVNEFTLDLLTKGHLIVFGEHSWRPYIHVADAARAILKVLKASRPATAGQVFNVGATSQNYRKLDLVQLLRKHYAEARIEYVDRGKDLRDYRVSFEKISRQLGFSTERTIEDGIAEVADFVRAHSTQRFDGSAFRN